MTIDGVLVGLTYDDAGNLLSDGTWTYTYDVENRLTSATDGATTVNYTYDPLGRRVAKTVNGAATYYLSDGTEEVLELNSSGNVLNRYIFGPGVDEPILMYSGSGISNGAKRYYRADPQGSIIAITDNDGDVIDTYTYSAYGEPDNPGGNAIRYTGRRWDTETGLYFYRSRYYSPALGRFLQTDPVGYQDQNNLYAYVNNDPMNGKDPTGEFGFFGAVLGGLIGAAVNVVVETAVQIASGDGIDGGKILAAGIGGAVSGAIVGGTGGALAGTAGAVGAATENLVNQFLEGGDIDAGEVLASGAAGFVGGKIGQEISGQAFKAVGEEGAGSIQSVAKGVVTRLDETADNISASSFAKVGAVQTVEEGFSIGVEEIANAGTQAIVDCQPADTCN